MRRIVLLLTLIGLCIYAKAQKETYNWAFGYGCGLTWNGTRSVAATGIGSTVNATLTDLPTFFNSSISTLEGCFSLSDSDGNLLFYSDGMTIYNKNNAVMANGSGMGGHNSSAQSGIILPFPESTTQYMAVSLGMTSAGNLAYSIIDMSLNAGLGGVTSQKNIRFPNPSGTTGESVTSIKHANETDYWVAAPGKGSPTYLNAWLVSSSGVSSSPVVTTCPTSISASTSNGYFKFTPDGKHFVYATYTGNVMMYGDFDRSTGIFSNIRTVTGLPSPYGVEFSLSMKYLYLVCVRGDLRVYDLEALLATNNPATIVPKTFSLGISTEVSAAQMGPDGRIYICPYSQNYLYVVDNPDEYDNLKVYRLPAGFLGKTTGVGLPTFAASWFSAKVTEKSFVCTSNDFKYTVEVSMSGPVSDQPTKLVWDFGDGSATVTQNIVSDQTIYKHIHNYATTGKYTITIIPYKANGAALSKITLPANVIDCVFKTNRMIRTDLQNTATKAVNR